MPIRKVAVKRKMRPKMTIRSGDEVLVISGKDRGKRGRVERVMPEANRAVVEGINMVKRHLKRQPGSLQAGIIDKPAPIHRSNLMLVCPNCNQPSRAAHTTLPDGAHVRMCKKCNEIIDKGQ
jgi:large subunit ribosomal protein L24